MWFDGIRQPNTIYVANTSRGKDSTAMLRAIQLMGWPLDMICSVDVWATDTIPAELPPMVAFKDEYDKKVLEWLGISVTRLCATKRERESCASSRCSMPSERAEAAQETLLGGRCSRSLGVENSRPKRLTYEDIFYRKLTPKRDGNFRIYGFPLRKGAWCQGRLKGGLLDTPLQPAPARGAEDKYRALHRHCGRRAKAHRQAYAEEGQGLAACANRVG